MDVSLQFAAAACNSVVNCFNWGDHNLVVYGAHHAVIIYEPRSCKVIHAMRGHEGRVNAVKWLHIGAYSWVVSGGSDGYVVISRCTEQEYAIVTRLSLGKSSITDIATEPVFLQSQDACSVVFWVAVCSTDSFVRVLQVEINESTGNAAVDIKQDIHCISRMMECVAFCTEPLTKRTMLAMGGADSHVHVYMGDGSRFVSTLRLVGHRDWVRSLDFAITDDGDVLLASSAQDNYIRLWRFTSNPEIVNFSPTSTKAEGDVEGSECSSLSQRGQAYVMYPETDPSASTVFAAVLDAVLIGHDAWVLSVQWHPRVAGSQPLALLSASQDRAMLIWEPDRVHSGIPGSHASSEDVLGVWLPVVRMGDVGGNVLGFFRGEWSPSGQHILGHGYHGSFHLWSQEVEGSEAPESKRWEPRVVLGGHHDAVVDLMWDPSFTYLISTSTDQTTRLWAEWTRPTDRAGETAPSNRCSWHEIARPQIHGYDQRCISFVRGRSHQYLAGAEEKVLRVFDAPATFVATLASITGLEVADDRADGRSLGANVPPLGLSNRPIQERDVAREMDDVTTSASSFRDELTIAAPVHLTEPPFEEFLLGSSLWPESQKLYGHGNELVSIASSYDGRLVATTCKASKPVESAIILWDTTSWKKLQELVAHRLTVVRVAFSHTDKYLLSVSRDRALSVFVRETVAGEEAGTWFRPLVRVPKAHDRIIWDCSWTADDRLFATASRDKKVKLWHVTASEKCELLATLPFRGPITAVDWLPRSACSGEVHWLAVGLESGGISVHGVALRVSAAGDMEVSWGDPLVFPMQICPVGSVVRLQWRGDVLVAGGHQLAVCSSDHSVRVYVISFPTPMLK